MADQRKDSIQVQLDESVNFPELLAGEWLSQRQLYHQKVLLTAQITHEKLHY